MLLAIDEGNRPLSVSRFNRFKSARTSDACWYRSSRSFSSALRTVASNPVGTSGFTCDGGSGSSRRMALQISPELEPSNGILPVAISYSTAPNEKRSVRESTSFARTCSGDM